MASEHEYRALIARLEEDARRAPGAYRLRLAALALVGFLVLGGSVVLALGMSVGLLLVLLAISPLLLIKLIKVIWIPLVFGWMILRALWVKFDPPEGHRLLPGEAPALVAEVERLRRATGAPRLDGIVIDSELNAGAMSLPRALGLLGQRHYLVVGLPLLRALSPEQMSGVIAHEFGHFGGGHARFVGWIYHVRVSWMRVLHALSMQQAALTGLFVRFFRWYAPYFNAYSFVLARDNEYQADAAAARVVGAETMGASLVRTELTARHLHEDFWPGVQRSVSTRERPPERLYADMAGSLAALRAADAGRLQQALERRPGYDDTHPTLLQRLQALGLQAPDAAAGPTPAPAISAADAWLGPLLPDLEARFSEDWHARVAEQWGAEHAQSLQAQARLQALEAMEATEADAPRTAAQRLEYARLVDRERPDIDALPLYLDVLGLDGVGADVLEGSPEKALAHFRAGALLLERGQADGAEHLRRAMALDPTATEPACELLYPYYREQGDDAGAAWVEQVMQGLTQHRVQAWQARQSLGPRDALLAHGLDDEALRAFRNSLAAYRKVGQVWLVRKSVDDPDPGAPPHFVALVQLRGFLFDADSSLQKVVDLAELPGTVVAVTVKQDRKLTRRIQEVAGAPAYTAHAHGR